MDADQGRASRWPIPHPSSTSPRRYPLFTPLSWPAFSLLPQQRESLRQRWYQSIVAYGELSCRGRRQQQTAACTQDDIQSILIFRLDGRDERTDFVARRNSPVRRLRPANSVFVRRWLAAQSVDLYTVVTSQQRLLLLDRDILASRRSIRSTDATCHCSVVCHLHSRRRTWCRRREL